MKMTSAGSSRRPGAQVVVPYPASNSSVRTRALHWVDRLEAAGMIDASEVAIVGPGFASTAMDDAVPTLLLRNVGRFSRGRREVALMRGGAPGVYDIDDGLPWDDGTLEDLGRWWKRPWPRSLIARRAASAADRMIVGNDVLADWASDFCMDVRVVPTCVEPADYVRRTAWEVPSTACIGWIGSPATDLYVRDIAPALRAVNERCGARVELIGASPDLARVVGPFCEVVPWQVDEAHARIATWDVGMMPLRDGVYERAKCGYKLLQYAAAGVPAVASPVGVNRAIIEAMDGAAPESGVEWIEALVEMLHESGERRRRRALAGFEVAERYSYAAHESVWVDAVGWPVS
jgi:glycosyltransferase involved in cell wall biosynthesis